MYLRGLIDYFIVPLDLWLNIILRYARAYHSSYECFIIRAARLSSKLLEQGYVMEGLKSSLRKFYGRYGDLIKHYEVTWHSGKWPCTMTPSIDQTLHQFAKFLPNWTLLPILTLLPNVRGFHRALQRVRLANRGRLLLRTDGPVPFGTCICSNVETILSWTCHVYEPFEFRTFLGTSILPFISYGIFETCFSIHKNRMVWKFISDPICITLCNQFKYFTWTDCKLIPNIL